MKEVTLQIPDGKRVEWKEVNGVTLPVLVDDVQPKDNRPVTERIKTLDDAIAELGNEHQTVVELAVITQANAANALSKDIVAFFKLRVIAAALNEGWQPQFMPNEYRYYPYFVLYTQEEIDEMDEDKRKELWLFAGTSDNGAACGLASAYSNNAWSPSFAASSARLAVKSRELAIYFGRQFKELWADYTFHPAFVTSISTEE